ncbi:MAG: T9SS type A sorting domain-containing protein [bacterium]|nr:MAG: T9SS type A sorting domain-containing protein [bacterium]
MRKLALFIFIVISLCSLPVSGEVPTDILHSFEDGPDDGAKPYGSLVELSDGRLCGMTSAGGTYSHGVIFSINKDGSDYSVLYHFGSTPNDGSSPRGSLTETDGKLYGMTGEGGTSAGGTIFCINPDGTGYDVLYHFGSAPDDGVLPVGSLIYVDSLLYGMTADGGTSASGTIFYINPDGTGYDVLYHFGSAPDDGITPSGSLTFIDSLLCGMTSGGGTYGGGTIFGIKQDGSDYCSISFGGTPEEPEIPIGSLTIGPEGKNFAFLGDGCFNAKGNFGIFLQVGSADGCNFKWPSFLPIHTFSGPPDDGACPSGSPTSTDYDLYGMTRLGGIYNVGAIFGVKPDGSGYNVFHNFGGAPSDGSLPFGSLTYIDGGLYGMTSIGGSSDVGVIFYIDAVEPPVATLLQSYTAHFRESAVIVRWTLSEVPENIEFFIQKAENSDEIFKELPSPEIIKDNLSFTFEDKECKPGDICMYRIGVLDADDHYILFETDPIIVPELPLTLFQNTPNPFNPVTTIRYYLPENSRITLGIYDISGKRVACLVNKEQKMGFNSVEWDGKDNHGNSVASGIYFFRLKTGKQTITRKMVLLR